MKPKANARNNHFCDRHRPVQVEKARPPKIRLAAPLHRVRLAGSFAMAMRAANGSHRHDPRAKVKPIMIRHKTRLESASSRRLPGSCAAIARSIARPVNTANGGKIGKM